MVDLLLFGLIITAIAIAGLKLPDRLYYNWEAVVHGLLVCGLFSVWLAWLLFLGRQVCALLLIFK